MESGTTNSPATSYSMQHTSITNICQTSSIINEYGSTQNGIFSMDFTFRNANGKRNEATPMTTDKMDIEEDYLTGVQNTFPKEKNRGQFEMPSWWNEDQLLMSNISNNNNTSSMQPEDSIKNSGHWIPLREDNIVEQLPVDCKTEWMHTNAADSFEQCHDIPFEAWYGRGDYEPAVLRATVCGSEKLGQSLFQSHGSYATPLAAHENARPPREESPTFSDLKVPPANQFCLPPISSLANKNDLHVSEPITPIPESSLTQSVCNLQNRPFLSTNIGGNEGFRQDLQSSLHQKTPNEFARLENIYHPTRNEVCIPESTSDGHCHAFSHLDREKPIASEPIHRLRISRNEMTQGRQLQSQQQKKSTSSRPELLSTEPRKRRPASNRPNPNMSKLENNADLDSEEQRTKKRLESNERERMRMHQLNDAFEGLREICPHVKNGRKLSKIETLTLARNYILSLTEIVVSLEENKMAKTSASIEVLRDTIKSELLEQDQESDANANEECASDGRNANAFMTVSPRPTLRRSNSSPTNRNNKRTKNMELDVTSIRPSTNEPYNRPVREGAENITVRSEFETIFGLNEERDIFPLL